MAQTIAPAVSGNESKRQLIGHGIGLALGSTAMALFLVLVGSLLRAVGAWRPPVVALATAVATLWAITTATGRGLPYPRSRWQVPVAWREELPPLWTVAVYGVLLGLGFATDVVLPAYWLLVGLTIATADVAASLAAWLAYAATRAVTTATAVRRQNRDGPDAVAGPAGLTIARLVTVSLLAAAALHSLRTWTGG
jgi:hypothetical protein